jgi:hypothetical protein
MSHTQTSATPDRVDMNATRLPSGENCGVTSTRAEFRNGGALDGRAGFPEPSSTMLQMLYSSVRLERRDP